MNEHIEAVAEAIWRADINNGHRDFDVSWAEDIGTPAKQHYRKLAQAAIDALRLTEERRELGGEDWPVDPTPNLTNGDPSGMDLDGIFAAIDAGRRQAER